MRFSVEEKAVRGMFSEKIIAFFLAGVWNFGKNMPILSE